MPAHHLAITAVVGDGPDVTCGDTLMDVESAVRRALENEAFEVGPVDVRLDAPKEVRHEVAESQAGDPAPARPPVPPSAGRTTFAQFLARYGDHLPQGQAAFMACDLAELLRLERAIERRRLTSDPGWIERFEAASRVTADELERSGKARLSAPTIRPLAPPRSATPPPVPTPGGTR